MMGMILSVTIGNLNANESEVQRKEAAGAAAAAPMSALSSVVVNDTESPSSVQGVFPSMAPSLSRSTVILDSY